MLVYLELIDRVSFFFYNNMIKLVFAYLIFNLLKYYISLI